MKDASKYLLNFIEMNLLGMRTTLTSPSNHKLVLFSLLALMALYLVSDPRALAIGFVIVPPCQNRKNLFFIMFSTIGSPILKWNKFAGMIAFEEENFYEKKLERVHSCSNCIFLIITVCPSSASAHFQSQACDFDAPSWLNTVYHFSRLFTLCYC